MGPIVTKTIAEIYLQQGHLKEAYEIYEALSKKDPADPEIQRRLKELKARLEPPSPKASYSLHSPEEKIRFLKRWLANIQKRKKGEGKSEP
ncbi:MAG: tetratricopeptide repeat protein [Thermodesulfobacteriota bacterium]